MVFTFGNLHVMTTTEQSKRKKRGFLEVKLSPLEISKSLLHLQYRLFAVHCPQRCSRWILSLFSAGKQTSIQLLLFLLFLIGHYWKQLTYLSQHHITLGPIDLKIQGLGVNNHVLPFQKPTTESQTITVYRHGYDENILM